MLKRIDAALLAQIAIDEADHERLLAVGALSAHHRAAAVPRPPARLADAHHDRALGQAPRRRRPRVRPRPCGPRRARPRQRRPVLRARDDRGSAHGRAVDARGGRHRPAHGGRAHLRQRGRRAHARLRLPAGAPGDARQRARRGVRLDERGRLAAAHGGSAGPPGAGRPRAAPARHAVDQQADRRGGLARDEGLRGLRPRRQRQARRERHRGHHGGQARRDDPPPARAGGRGARVVAGLRADAAAGRRARRPAACGLVWRQHARRARVRPQRGGGARGSREGRVRARDRRALPDGRRRADGRPADDPRGDHAGRQRRQRGDARRGGAGRRAPARCCAASGCAPG